MQTAKITGDDSKQEQKKNKATLIIIEIVCITGANKYSIVLLRLKKTTSYTVNCTSCNINISQKLFFIFKKPVASNYSFVSLNLPAGQWK